MSASELQYYHWPCDGQPRAIVVLVHGLAEHAGRYQHVAEALNGRGIAVLAVDHVGHGRSPGQRGHLDRFDEYLDGVSELVDRAARDYPNLPVFLLGHSMGGLIASAWILDHEDRLAGGILSGAALRPPQPPGWFQRLMLRIMARLFPRSGQIALEAGEVSRDPQVVAAYDNDELVYRGKITAGLVNELFKAMDRVEQNAGQITLPLLILHGGADVMTDPGGSRWLNDTCRSSDCTLKIYDGLFHEILNEPEREQVLGDIIEWIEARLESPS